MGCEGSKPMYNMTEVTIKLTNTNQYLINDNGIAKISDNQCL